MEEKAQQLRLLADRRHNVGLFENGIDCLKSDLVKLELITNNLFIVPEGF